MNNTLDSLQPAAVWKYFGELMNIPRPSKHEAKVSAFLQDFGRKLGFETLADEVGNVLIRKPAAPGYENAPRVCLQAHIDMVCEKTVIKNSIFLPSPSRPMSKTVGSSATVPLLAPTMASALPPPWLSLPTTPCSMARSNASSLLTKKQASPVLPTSTLIG